MSQNTNYSYTLYITHVSNKLTLSLLYANEVNLPFSCSKSRLTGNFKIKIKIYMLSRFLGQDMQIKDHRNKDKWLLYCLS